MHAYLISVPGREPYKGLYSGAAAAIAHAIEMFGARGASARRLP
ncbi:hypothetical protein QRO08_16765 [Paracidovorax citrulli]|uniref:DUF1330 domain-containing protein n=1 Tax=Paracidovorax citrulli TaxID=80869 RepID=A0ABY9AKL3_PARCI|nr:hypothetical protein [Paracidovorax citrulli]PVY66382.1 hypothetical protein C8E08_3789 [Paracidovorax citrulli]REG69447.1 hypothetical protein C8E07_2598 [Paracidovorax citrulli]RLJ94001.1 hypothetical protein C8E06_2597 [Paracidovorax citrulli]WIY27927.1 hypothetical protein QRO09_12645 [Paracidovorax citrulli]WIY37159.1 hypothetical protein QRO10_12920 [Paracidovorax citrulli]